MSEENNNEQQDGEQGKPETGRPVPWEAKGEAFDAEKAKTFIQSLTAERDRLKADHKSVTDLQATIDQMKAAQAAQSDALAKALGVKPEETTDAEKVSSEISDLRAQLGTLQRNNVLLSSGIDAEAQQKYAHLLTATDPAALALQAQTVAELTKTTAQQTAPPAFQQLNGQGQRTNDPSIKDQLAAAEKEAGAAVPGSPEQRAAMARAMQLKSQQLAALKP